MQTFVCKNLCFWYKFCNKFVLALKVLLFWTIKIISRYTFKLSWYLMSPRILNSIMHVLLMKVCVKLLFGYQQAHPINIGNHFKLPILPVIYHNNKHVLIPNYLERVFLKKTNWIQTYDLGLSKPMLKQACGVYKN